MAEIVGSAVVQESVSQIVSGLLQKYEDKHNSNAFRNLERLEMAHIRLEAVLQTSDKWDITDTSLLRWRRKLKSAAQECDDTLHRCRQRILEDEHIEKEVSNSSVPKRVVHATRSFVSSIFNHDNDDLNISIIQRFEWFADGASEFLRLLELGGTPRCHMPFDPLIRHLFAGKILQHRIIRANKCPLFLQLAPFFSAEHGIQGRLYFMQKDPNEPDDDFCFTVTLQLSESTDIVGVAIQCLHLFAPIFMSTVENIRKRLMQLPTEDFSWVPYVDSHQKKHWDNVHRFGSQWFRPNPLCCKQHDKNKLCHSCKVDKSSGLPYVSLEPVIYVGLWCQVSLSESDKQRASLSECRSSLRDHPYQRAGVLFAPHGSSEDILLVDKFPAIAATNSEEQHCLHPIFTLGQLEGIMLPKAIDYFCQNEEATVYQMLWRSRHGTAYIQVERASIFRPSTRQAFHGAKRKKLLQGLDEEFECLTYWVSRFLDLWTSHASIQLEGSIMDWYQEVKEKHKQHITAA
ncbi:unnamed protein product [Miscanthus lutarioriparius]|uniref:Rx N-terminal domain-containing protein n=1 Tax=Miscanthus lutarioriparius TaxID=422564 RepID=A0A811NCW0_9POAL|nr:unnamed protein product [Miscanthus lutarioriparius]